MRTTVDLPDDILRQVKNIAADRRTSVSRVISKFVTDAISPPDGIDSPRIVTDPRTGLKSVDFGRPITMEEVRQALDDE